MSPLTSYILGILTFLIPFLVFYVLSLNYEAIQNSWNNLFGV